LGELLIERQVGAMLDEPILERKVERLLDVEAILPSQQAGREPVG
jgi:hypothetical protein